MIPKIIHYCWLSNEPIPENMKAYLNRWKEMMPDYEYKLWNFERFPKANSIWVSEAFDNKKYAFAADYIRLYAIYNYGGIYMDMDIEVRKRFDSLLDAPIMIGYENEGRNTFEAGCFGAEKGNIFVRECLKSYERQHFVQEDGSFNQLPLPQRMMAVNNEMIMRGMQDEIPHNVKPCNYFTAKSFDTGEIFADYETYAIHHFAGSWKTEKEKKIIDETQKNSRKYGHWLAKNFAEYKYNFQYEGFKGIWNLTLEKIKRKI